MQLSIKSLYIKALYLLIAVSLVLGAIFLPSYYELYQFADSFKPSTAQSRGKFLIVWNYGIGESETIERIKIAGKNLAPIIDIRAISTTFKFTKQRSRIDPIRLAIKIFKPDFVLALHGIDAIPNIRNYITLTLGAETFVTRNANGAGEFIDTRLAEFDAILTAYSDLSLFEQAYKQYGRKVAHMPWYVTSYITSYAPALPKELFYSGGVLWDERRASAKYKEVFQMLDKTNYFTVCGAPDKWQHITRSFRGAIPVDGKSLINEIHNAGISLVLHSDTHLKSGVPTARIFEATSANAVIISDKHPFVIENFGDNVLYIDVDKDANEIFKQINEHMQWIFNNQEQARQKAQACNDIFRRKYSLEQQLVNLLQMHNAL